MRRIQGPYCCVVLWWRFQLVGAGRFDPSLAVRWVAPTTHSISCLDSSLGRVPACDTGDPGLIPGGGKLNACPLPGSHVSSIHYCLDSSWCRVPACDAGDLGSIPGGGKLNAWDKVPFWPLDPGSGIGFFRIPDLGSWIPTPYFWELIDNFG